MVDEKQIKLRALKLLLNAGFTRAEVLVALSISKSQFLANLEDLFQ